MAKSTILVDLDDPRTEKISEVLGNKTCKKILSILSERELSESDIAMELKIPLNTAGYNIKKLAESGLIEKSKKFFWSQKGRRIVMYKISNKRIVISPKSMIKGVFPAVVVSGLIALGIKLFVDRRVSLISRTVKRGGEIASESAAMIQPAYGTNLYYTPSGTNLWFWFLIGALVSLLIFLVWNWLVEKKK